MDPITLFAMFVIMLTGYHLAYINYQRYKDAEHFMDLWKESAEDHMETDKLQAEAIRQIVTHFDRPKDKKFLKEVMKPLKDDVEVKIMNSIKRIIKA